jgi:hypothetical protein
VADPPAPPGGAPPGGVRGWSAPEQQPGAAPLGGYGIGLPPGVPMDYGQTGPSGTPGGSPSSSLATTSVVLGACSLAMSFCCSPVGLALGIAAMACGGVVISRTRHDESQSSARTLGIVGTVLGGLSLLYFVAILAFFGVSMFSSVLGAP